VTDPTRALYLRSLADAMARPTTGDPSRAVQEFLTLNAAYFLGEWLPARLHARLVRRLAPTLDGLADLPVPSHEPAASQLAQHARELAALCGRTFWTDRIAAQTRALIPARPEDWDVALRTAVAGARDHPTLSRETADSLLLAHAQRRLWELTNPRSGEAVAAPVAGWALRFARRAADRGDGRLVQAAEALLAELAYGLGRGPGEGPRPALLSSRVTFVDACTRT
jgi:hypothetical protein